MINVTNCIFLLDCVRKLTPLAVGQTDRVDKAATKLHVEKK